VLKMYLLQLWINSENACRVFSNVSVAELLIQIYVFKIYSSTMHTLTLKTSNFRREVRLCNLRDRRRGLLKLIVLSSIIKHEKIHGYGVYKEVTSLASGGWNPSIGTIYRILNKLVAEGYVNRDVVARNGRKIVYYTITERGVEEFFKIAECLLNKIYTGMELLIPALRSLKARDRRVEIFDNALEKILHVIKGYLGE